MAQNPTAGLGAGAIAEARPPGGLARNPITRWLRANLFNTWLNSAVTLIVLYFAIKGLWSFMDWAFLSAHFEVDDTRVCREAKEGACWALITEKHRFILFGTYPYEEQWRALIVIFLFIALYVVSAMRRFWNRRLALIWAVGLFAIGVLMWGGVLGLRYVENERWGGLPLTLMLATFGIALAFPLGIALALGRRSNMPAIQALCVVYIELIRGVPLISLLFMASVMFPLFLPEGMTIDKLLRAQVAIIMFAAAYLAEVIRGGLQAIPKGQFEAADSLGLSYIHKTGKIILPQALKLVIPPLVNSFIGLFKDTSLVLIIGLFDLLNSAKASIIEPKWVGFGVEAYVFVSIIYFAFCFAMSKYSQELEATLARGHKR
ncbi:MAG TPA: amino acid ABC transporter permease [Alphaproteobacteria bacterium]|nr:amino acid ABC transporter permease [Alphaproteobacteria bacterium]